MFRTLLLIFCLTGSLSAFAQSHIGLGVGGGLGERTGLRASFHFEFPLNTYLSLLPEFNFVQRRNRDLLRQLLLLNDRDYRQATVNYLSIPILLKLQLSFKTLNPYAVIGPELAYGMNIQTYYVQNNRIFSEDLTFQNSERLDVGINMGLGLDKTLNRGHKIFLEYRFFLGLWDILSAAEQESYNEGSSLVLGFSYRLRL